MAPDGPRGRGWGARSRMACRGGCSRDASVAALPVPHGTRLAEGAIKDGCGRRWEDVSIHRCETGNRRRVLAEPKDAPDPRWETREGDVLQRGRRHADTVGVRENADGSNGVSGHRTASDDIARAGTRRINGDAADRRQC